MNERVAIRREELAKAAGLARSLEHGAALAALCYDVLSRQAEGGSLFSGKKFLAGRAKAHGVSREQAQTPIGDLLSVLERGPESPVQWALVAALCVRGFEAAVRAAPDQRKALCAKLAAHGDFLELASPYRIWPLIDALLEPELASDVYAALAALVLRDDEEQADPRDRARNAGRIAGLASGAAPGARGGLERIEAGARDAYSRTLASLALGRSATRAPTSTAAPPSDAAVWTLRGQAHGVPRGAFVRILGWVSGYSLARWALRLPLSVLGYVCDVGVELAGDAIRVQRTTTLLGRVMQTSEQVYPLGHLNAAQRTTRFPTMHFVLGAFCFGIGIVFGGIFAFDAARTGDQALWLIAGALILLGSGLDLLFDVLLPGGRGRVALDLDFGRAHRMRVASVPLADADAFLRELFRRLARQETRGRAVP